jgi:hypothetical protein
LQVVQPLVQQFGIHPAGLLDTQVCAGLLALAATGTAAAPATAPISLAVLLAQYGYGHISQQLEQLGGSELGRLVAARDRAGRWRQQLHSEPRRSDRWLHGGCMHACTAA